jgi:hypothetical protein
MRLALLILSLSLLPVPASAAGVLGGSLNRVGLKSHNVAGGWPDFLYVWEGLAKEKMALGPRVDLRAWPLALNLGMHARFSLVDRDKFSMAFYVHPAIGLAAFGGAKGTYPLNFGYGRSRFFRFSVGPVADFGLLASIHINPRWHVIINYENPVAVWVWTNPTAWFAEWPFVFSGGIEYDAFHAVSLFGRIGGGPTVAFSGASQLLGFTWHVQIGAQFR